MNFNKTKEQQNFAAVDLGSNSFHMIVVRVENDQINVVDRLKEMVRLGGGLDENNHLNQETKDRALACLQRFGERVKDFPQGSVSAVGTNTLRLSTNAQDFLDQARKALGHAISIISGQEEARLIYLGVAHSLAPEKGNRFVMDIGGGSTELIIGQGFEPHYLNSLKMGCVSFSRKFFSEGKLNKKCWKKANHAAHLKLIPFKRKYKKIGWDNALGASGSIKSIGKVIKQLGLSAFGITLENLYHIRDVMIKAGHLDQLKLAGLSEDRRPVFAGGLAVLIATFEALKINNMQVSSGALREGLIYDRQERLDNHDVRSLTVENMQQRCLSNSQHALNVRNTTQLFFLQSRQGWDLTPENAKLLYWAALLHEVGLSIAHNSYHKHGAYLLDHADLAGFSREEQHWLSLLVRYHRSKLSEKWFKALLPKSDRKIAMRLTLLLRLAILLHRSRSGKIPNICMIQTQQNQLKIVFDEGELEQYPLLKVDLKQEKKYWKAINFKLLFS